jgi:hypothetical protein
VIGSRGRSGSGSPSVYDMSKTETARNSVIVSSVSSLLSSSRRLTTIGAIILIECSPLRTCRPTCLHALNPATCVASGYCMAINMQLFVL